MLNDSKLFLCVCLIIALGFIGIPESLFAQETSKPLEAPKSFKYVENFNGSDRSTMLGGQINFPSGSKWIVTTTGGKLLMENRINPKSVHWNDIKWVRYEGDVSLSSTQGTKISVTVEAMNESRGGAGILVGSGERKKYLMFSVDGNGRYHVLERNRRKAVNAYSGTSDAVRPGQSNRLSYEWRNEKVVFFANGIEVIQIPFSIREGAGIGLAAFGLGTYTFDDVEITK